MSYILVISPISLDKAKASIMVLCLRVSVISIDI